jgi:hypothetical protein
MRGLMMEAQGVTQIPLYQMVNKCLDFNLASYNGLFRVLQATTRVLLCAMEKTEVKVLLRTKRLVPVS